MKILHDKWSDLNIMLQQSIVGLFQLSWHKVLIAAFSFSPLVFHNHPALADNKTTIDNTNQILFHSADQPYKASLKIKPQNSDWKPDFPNKFLAVSGTYTDKTGQMMGFTAHNGEILRRHFLKWDGLAVINDQGQFHLGPVGKFSFDGKLWNLKSDFPARLKFMDLVKSQRLTVLQSHLLVTDGKIDVRKRPEAKENIRRLVVQRKNGEILIYDSSPNPLTLFEAANIAHHELDAHQALNLDMGTYNYCARRSEKNKAVELCGYLENTNKLTNILVIEY